MYGEMAAENYLIKQGFKILETGFRCRSGEIDIIASLNKDIYFIEVKTRWSLDFGSPLEAVDLRKQGQIIRVAEFYMIRPACAGYECCHLSVIGVDMTGDEAKIEFIADAFET